LEQDAAGAGITAGRGFEDEREVSGCVRAVDWKKALGTGKRAIG
jgi:hypothetical protein